MNNLAWQGAGCVAALLFIAWCFWLSRPRKDKRPFIPNRDLNAHRITKKFTVGSDAK
jgi:hypothetical protein